MGTKKRLSEWTLAECKEYCRKRPKVVGQCTDCELYNANICTMTVSNWDFETLTDGEKAIMRACRAKWVTLDFNDDRVELWTEKPKIYKDGSYIANDLRTEIGRINKEVFPSLSGGDCIELEE